ncbi:hypothetical protein IWQ56_006500 [Coemansia nantahalensis]|uniref:Uncharacterized protein n=2 Tax=Coemansia TaxID=4863 RepID=A0ACC1KUT5_9FUNG|nr:hypothetical protein IWQ56_006500 [Coemansia nantahalensis]KAJ2767725.1 hypothetical protein IWQ57_003836 [Coemansia nantahalensis]KAJ2795703.1 hypothetical protein H4R21_005006 [Coemansia helicoidea]
MVKTVAPELKNYMDKRLRLELNAKRVVIGVLRGFDAFMNVNLDDAREVLPDGEFRPLRQTVIRGNSIELIEALEPLDA